MCNYINVVTTNPARRLAGGHRTTDSSTVPSTLHCPMRVTWAALILILVAGAFAWAIERTDILPRRLATYVEQRAFGHRAEVVQTGRWIANTLLGLDRGARGSIGPVPSPKLGTDASETRIQVDPKHSIIVGSPDEALRAIAEASPGDVITFLPGTYRFTGRYIDIREPGTRADPITVRGASVGDVVLEFDMVEGFLVSAPYWLFENLTIRGVCADHSACEHAFHVISGAANFVARHNVVVDFNSHFKINGGGGLYPDFGTIEGNTLRNTAVRNTENPVTPIDLVAASHWRIHGNRISDFMKGQSDRISYGAFAKGGGTDNRFERNIVICEERLQLVPGQRIGLSLGGGGTSHAACRAGRCVTEQDRGVVASNLIASCSDDGIYLNRAAMSSITHNTLIDTAGIAARFPESTADVEGNLVDGVIRDVAGAVVRANDNRVTHLMLLYLGVHPVRRLFVDAPALDLRWRGKPPRRREVDRPPADLCGQPRPLAPSYGAFEDLDRCLVP